MSVIPSSQKVELRRIMFQSQPGQNNVSESPISIKKKNLEMVAHACLPIYLGDISRRVINQAGLGKTQDPVSKIT
jgi:hypothetical protein